MSNPDSTTKTCTVCKRELPATNEYFHNFRGGLHPRCKDCRRKQQQEYFEKHPEKVRAQKRRHYDENRDKIIERVKQWGIDNPDKVRENRRRVYYERHEESRAYQRQWKAAHREQIRTQSKIYRENNRDKKREADRKWKAANPDKVKEYARKSRIKNAARVRASNRNRKARVRNAEGSHTTADIEAQKLGQTDSKGRLRCWWCGKIIKNGDYHVDHVIPITKDGRNDVGNLVISCPKCNQVKSDRMPWEFNGRLL